MRDFVAEMFNLVGPPDGVDTWLWWLFIILCTAGLIFL